MAIQKLREVDLEQLRQAKEQEQQKEADQEMLIADLMAQNAELQLQLIDLNMVVADLMAQGGGK